MYRRPSQQQPTRALRRATVVVVAALVLLLPLLLFSTLKLQYYTQARHTLHLQFLVSSTSGPRKPVSAQQVWLRQQPAVLSETTGPAGHQPIEGISVLFGIVGRDVAAELPYVLANIARLAANFKEAHVVFVENDSRDDTQSVFTSWGATFTAGHSNRTTKLVSFDAASGKKELRLLALARNRYLEQLSLPEYDNVDYLIAVDTDMCWPWDIPNMVKIINDLLPSSGSEWHALYANGACGWYKNIFKIGEEEVPPLTPGSANIYCDLFALRDSTGVMHRRDGSNPNDVAFIPGTCDFSAMKNHSAMSFTCRHLNGHAVVPVHAAFGGWGMYTAHLLRTTNSSTACTHDDAAGGCEHLSLSNCFIRKFNATQIIATGMLVNWEGCSAKEQQRWDTWYAGRALVAL